jgi:hypothetical protein
MEKHSSSELAFTVMDEEVTADRAIGEGKIGVKELLSSEGSVEVPLFYKGKESSGKVRVQASITSAYLIFRNKSTITDGAFYLHN